MSSSEYLHYAEQDEAKESYTELRQSADALFSAISPLMKSKSHELDLATVKANSRILHDTTLSLRNQLQTEKDRVAELTARVTALEESFEFEFQDPKGRYQRLKAEYLRHNHARGEAYIYSLDRRTEWLKERIPNPQTEQEKHWNLLIDEMNNEYSTLLQKLTTTASDFAL